MTVKGYIELDVADVIEKISDEDLAAELAKRRLKRLGGPPLRNIEAELKTAFETQDVIHFRVLVGRVSTLLEAVAHV